MTDGLHLVVMPKRFVMESKMEEIATSGQRLKLQRNSKPVLGKRKRKQPINLKSL